ncbi:MAG: hypothetical protein AB1413_04205 [Thermodesulfobacteriota bacterium]
MQQTTVCQCQKSAKEGEQTTPVTLEMPVGLLRQLEEAAAVEGGDYREVLLCYARQGLAGSSAKLKREQFVEHAREVLQRHGVQTNVLDEIFSKFLY